MQTMDIFVGEFGFVYWSKVNKNRYGTIFYIFSPWNKIIDVTKSFDFPT